MFILKINRTNGKNEQSDFKTYDECAAHFEKYKEHWGKETHTIHHEEQVIHHEAIYFVDENGVVVEPKIISVESRDEVIPAWDEQVPAEYTYIIEDHTAEVEAGRVKKETKHNDRVSRVDQLKAIDWTTITTIASLKNIVKALVKEAIKDDE